MKILIAPDSFKGSLSAVDACRAIAAGIRRAAPGASLDLLPIADGGEGTTEALVTAAGGERRTIRVPGPLGEPVDSFFGLIDSGRTAVVEAAAACGLPQVLPERRDPRVTTSRGLGDLLRAAAAAAPERILVGIGGSATNDGGAGMLRALGVRFLDDRGDDLPEGGAALARLARLDRSAWRWPADAPKLVVASDVTNPLCGPNGASAVYGPQKGATPDMVDVLDRALSRFARIAAEELGDDASERPGAGAAGGIGFALMAFMGADLRPGIDLVLEAVGFDRRAAAADLVVTGEGRLDGQTRRGKAVQGVARAGRAAGARVVALVGALEGDVRSLRNDGLLAAMPIAAGPASLDALMRGAGECLADAAERMMEWLEVGMSLETVGS